MVRVIRRKIVVVLGQEAQGAHLKGTYTPLNMGFLIGALISQTFAVLCTGYTLVLNLVK